MSAVFWCGISSIGGLWSIGGGLLERAAAGGVQLVGVKFDDLASIFPYGL